MKNSNFDALLSLVGDISEKLKSDPAGAEVFRKIQSGDLTEDDAVKILFDILFAKGSLSEILGSTNAIELLDAPEETLPVVTEKSGQTVVNPLWEAALAERVSLDGDVPSLRHGPMPPEGKPAVPVILDSHCPITAGWMLEKASHEVKQKLSRIGPEHQEIVSRTLAITEKKARDSGTDVKRALEIARKHLPEPPKGIPGYSPGENPQFLKVAKPTGSELSSLTDEEASFFAYRALATTQGRLSLVQPIANALTKELCKKGLTVIPGVLLTQPVAKAQWFMTVYGAGDLSPKANYVETAISALAENLLSGVPKQEEGVTLICEVTPYNGISTRTFGWEARIGGKNVHPR